jgi:hypothetical protein
MTTASVSFAKGACVRTTRVALPAPRAHLPLAYCRSADACSPPTHVCSPTWRPPRDIAAILSWLRFPLFFHIPRALTAADRVHLALALHLLGTTAYAVAAKTQAVPAWCARWCAPSVGGAVMLECFSQILISVVCLLDVLLLQEDTPSGGAGMLLLTERACAYWRAMHVVMATKWVGTQLPLRVVLLPELSRGAACLLVALAAVAAWQPGGLTMDAALWLLLHACGATVCVLAAVCACHNRAFSVAHLPPALLSCPGVLRPHVDAAAGWLEDLTRAHLPVPAADFSTVLGTAFAVISLCAFSGVTGVLTVSRRVNYVCVASTLVSFASRLPAGTTAHLRLLQRRLGVADAQHMHMSLCAQLDGCTSEHHVLWAAAEQLRTLFPAATALALGLLTDGDPSGRREVAILRVAAAHEPQRRALAAALQAAVVDGAAAALDDPTGSGGCRRGLRHLGRVRVQRGRRRRHHRGQQGLAARLLRV